MHAGDGDRLAALLGGADLRSAPTAFTRVAGPELTRLAYLVLQNRPAAEAAAAAAIDAAVRRAMTAGWRPTGRELGERLITDVLRAALQSYDGTHEVDPLGAGRPAALPADPVRRAVVVAVLMGDVPVDAVARAVRIRESRARQMVRDAIAAAGSEERLREDMAVHPATIPLAVSPSALYVAPELRFQPPHRGTMAPAVAGVSLVLMLAVMGMAKEPTGTANHPAASGVPTPPSAVPSPGAGAASLPTLASCGIGPPDATLAFAGWLTVEQLGAAAPDATEDQRFYALVPAGDVAWNPPGLSRRIMPPVRGRLACLSTLSGHAPTVVGLPSDWTPPPTPRQRRLEHSDCGLHPADAPLAHRRWLLAEAQLPVVTACPARSNSEPGFQSTSGY